MYYPLLKVISRHAIEDCVSFYFNFLILFGLIMDALIAPTYFTEYLVVLKR